MPSTFDWKKNATPTVFARDRSFRAYSNGRGASHVATQRVEDFTKKHGRNVGSIPGLSSRGDAAADQFQQTNLRRRAK